MRIGILFPRRHREALLGDLVQDLKDYRLLGFSERRLLYHVIQQLLYAYLARVSLLGFFAWIGRSVAKLIAG